MYGLYTMDIYLTINLSSKVSDSYTSEESFCTFHIIIDNIFKN